VRRKPKPMKIAFIGQKGIPTRSGGVEKHVEEIATRLASYGHEVFVYARPNYTDKNLLTYQGVTIINLPSVGTKNLDAITHTLLATLHALFKKYDVIHYQAVGPSSLSWIARLFKRNTAIVATFHCQDHLHQKWGLLAREYLKLSEWATCKFPHQTITVSDSLKKYADEKYGIESRLIFNGAEVKNIKEADLLSEFNLRSKKYIVCVGRLVKHKGVHYLIEAFKQLEDTTKMPNGYKLVIVGDGAHTDDYVKYLKFISQGRDNIIFTGNQTGKKLEQLFANAQIFVQPSESEGMSIALLEAMGYGVVPLVSNIKENTEVIKDTGKIFRSKDIVDLKKQLAYLINKPDEAIQLGECAQCRIEEEFSWDSITRKTETVYFQNLIKKIKPTACEHSAKA
jgi:glycosyltransferase involved in cell wall biosynthesis